MLYINTENNNNLSTVWSKVFLSFNILSSYKDAKNRAVFSNFYVLGQRSCYYIVNPFAVGETLNRIFILIRGIVEENPKYQKWVFSFNVRHAAIARWFGWSIGASVFSRLTKNNGFVSNGGLILHIKSSMVVYTFLSYIGMDLAFVLSSKNSGGRAEMLTQKSLLAIGFDGNDVWTYAYNMPGVRSVRSVVLYSRIFSMLFLKLQ